MPKKGKQGGARPPATGRAKRVGIPRVSASELNRRRRMNELDDQMVVLRNTMELVLLELQRYGGNPDSEEE